jgi:hypothetical protein
MTGSGKRGSMPFLGAWTLFGGVKRELTKFWQEGQLPLYRLVVMIAVERYQAHSKNVCSCEDSRF